jgi:virulence factor Mce-like protein
MRRLLAPALLLAIGIAVFIGGNQLLFPQGSGYTVRAEFADVSGLYKDSAVKVGGVTAGIVDSLALTRRDTALVTMTLNHGAAPIGAGATAAIRPVNLLGENYVALQAGDLRRPAASGTLIPLARTSHAVELDDVLNTLDPDTRMRLAILINESGVALDGHGTDFNALLAQLPGSLDQARRLLSGLNDGNGRLQQLITQGNQVITAMNSRSGDLQNLVDNAAATLQAVASRRAALGATIANAPAALIQARNTIGQLGAAALELRPLGAALQSIASPLTATLGALPSFAAQARPALRSLAANAPALGRLASGALAPVQKLAPAAGRLNDVAGQLAPVMTALDSGNTFRDLLDLMFGWARTIQQRDGLGHIFGLRLTLNANDLTSVIQRLLKLHPGTTSLQRAPAATAAPARSAAQSLPAPNPPAGPASAGPAAGAAKPPPPAALASTAAGVGASLQSTTKQLSGLLAYLLGRGR